MNYLEIYILLYFKLSNGDTGVDLDTELDDQCENICFEELIECINECNSIECETSCRRDLDSCYTNCQNKQILVLSTFINQKTPMIIDFNGLTLTVTLNSDPDQ